MKNNITFGTWLKVTRMNANETVRELEKRSGVSNATISQLETGTIINTTILTAEILANSYDTKLWKVLKLADK